MTENHARFKLREALWLKDSGFWLRAERCLDEVAKNIDCLTTKGSHRATKTTGA